MCNARSFLTSERLLAKSSSVAAYSFSQSFSFLLGYLSILAWISDVGKDVSSFKYECLFSALMPSSFSIASIRPLLLLTLTRLSEGLSNRHPFLHAKSKIPICPIIPFLRTAWLAFDASKREWMSYYNIKLCISLFCSNPSTALM